MTATLTCRHCAAWQALTMNRAHPAARVAPCIILAARKAS